MQLKEPFITSFGTELDKEFLLLTLRDTDGAEGWSECVAMEQPIYNEETSFPYKHIKDTKILAVFSFAQTGYGCNIFEYIIFYGYVGIPVYF